MAIDRFIPQVWSAKLLSELRKALVYGQPEVVNRDYEGDIAAAGDCVKIHGIGAVTVCDYVKNADLPAPQTLSDEEQTLMIDQAKAFNFAIDDIDAAQQTPKLMTEAMADAAYRLAEIADRYIAAQHAQAGGRLGSDGAPVTAGKDNAYDLLVDMATLLSEQNAPQAGRWVVVPPWFHGLLLKDARFTGTGGAAAERMLKNGAIGMAAGFVVLESNNVPAEDGKCKILAGVPAAWSYAEQVAEMNAYRPEKRFADAVKGLHVYGAKVVKPDALVCMTAVKA